MSVTITSTTDSAEDVAAATGNLTETKPEEVNKSESAEKDEADETPEESEVSEDESIEEDEDKPKKAKSGRGFKRRIDKLNSRLAEEAREKEYWRQEALKHTQTASKKPEGEAQKRIVEGKPSANDFDDHADYVEALADWKTEQKLAERDLKAREAQVRDEHQKQVTGFQERLSGFKEAHEDFDELIEELDDVRMSLTVQEVIIGSDIGPELMYELAKNKKEYERICSLTPIAAARELGKIEARIQRSSDSTEKSKEVKTTKAPKPIKPVGSKASSATLKSPDEMSFQEYKKWRQANPNG